jgi:hypothetical protein
VLFRDRPHLIRFSWSLRCGLCAERALAESTRLPTTLDTSFEMLICSNVSPKERKRRQRTKARRKREKGGRHHVLLGVRGSGGCKAVEKVGQLTGSLQELVARRARLASSSQLGRLNSITNSAGRLFHFVLLGFFLL